MAPSVSQYFCDYLDRIRSMLTPHATLPEIWEKIYAGDCISEILVKNITYWSTCLPFTECKGVVGRLDYIRLKEENRLLIRGWIFSLYDITNEVHLNLTGEADDWHLVLANNLSRNDVKENFPFVPYSQECGFVALIETAGFKLNQTLSVSFRLELANGQVKLGTFAPVTISPALSS